MLDAQTIATVKATIPLLIETGPKLTAHSYDCILTHNPEPKEIFNMSNQRNDDQREALFNATAAYVSNIENLFVLLPAVEKTAQKYTSFQIKPKQYNTIGEHLLATLDEMFSPGQEVLDTWGKVYGILANVFINREAKIYNENASKAGGWEDTRDFRTVAKIPHSALITSPELGPVDDDTAAERRPEQYPGVRLGPEGFPYQETRQYSLTRKPDGRGYHIAVKCEGSGQVSNWLYNHTNVGDVVKLVASAGDFFMTVADDIPMTLISVGVGQTLVLVMLDTLAKTDHTARMNWFHMVESGDVHVFTDEVKELGQSLPRFTAYTWYRRSNEADHAKGQFDSEGLMDLNKLEGASSDPTTQFYLYGPVGFMQFTAKQLVDLDVKQESIRYECFGPHKAL